MLSSSNTPLTSAGPGTPVTISGWKDLPRAGDEVLEGKEGEVKSAVENRKRNKSLEALAEDVKAVNEKRMREKEREKLLEAEKSTGSASASSPASPSPALQPIHLSSADSNNTLDGAKEFRIIIKADVSGSAEALSGALSSIGNSLARLKIISSSVGEPTETDVDLARAVGASIVAFSVKPSSKILSVARSAGVDVLSDGVIYRLMDSVREKVQALLPVVVEQRVLGEATVLQVFEIKGKGKSVSTIAGCRITNGIIERAKTVKVLRDGEEIFSGKFLFFLTVVVLCRSHRLLLRLNSAS